MALLALLQSDKRAAARLKTALGHDHELLHFTSWKPFLDALSREPVEGCILDIYHPRRPISLPRIQRLRQRHPTLAIVVYSDFSGREMELFQLGRLSVDGVILAGRGDDRHKMREAVRMGLSASVASRVADALQGRIAPVGLLVLQWAVEHAHEHPGVDALAEMLCVSPSSLSRELRVLGLPTARRLLLWGRLLQAGRLLESRGTTAEEVAHRLGYATASGLRRALKSHCGCPPTVVAERGGLSWVLQCFIRRELGEGSSAPRWRSRHPLRWARKAPVGS